MKDFLLAQLNIYSYSAIFFDKICFGGQAA